MNLLKNILIELDYLGIKPKITYDGAKRYKTILGGGLSVILSVFFMAEFFYLSDEILEKNNPNIIIGEEYNSNQNEIKLEPKTFPFFLAIEDPTNSNNYFKDDTIFLLKAYLIMFSTINDLKSNIQISTEVKLGNCNLTYHFPGIESDFNSTDYKNAFCINSEENIFLIRNNSNHEIYILKYYLYPCNNSTSKGTCKSQEIIDSKLNSFFIDFHYGFNFNSPKNYLNAVNKRRTNYFTSSSNKGKKEINVFLKQMNFTTDIGLIILNPVTESFQQVDTINEFTYTKNPLISDYLTSVNIRLSFKIETNFRSYLKVQNILSRLGGLLIILTLSGVFLNKILIQKFYYFELINKNFKLKDDKNNEISNKKIDSFDYSGKFNLRFNVNQKFEATSKLGLVNCPIIIPTIKEFEKITHNRVSLNLINSNNNHLKEDNVNYDNLLDIKVQAKFREKLNYFKNGRKLNFTIISYITDCFPCLLKKRGDLNYKDLYLKGKARVNKIMDINEIIKKFISLDNLINLILNDNQLDFFNNLAYNINNNETDQNCLFNKTNNTSNLTQIITKYENLKKDTDTLSKKLLEYSDKNFISFLNEFI